MRINGKNLKRRLYGATRLHDRVRRARYFRGHGVHSPFVYAIVRQVFMRDRLPEGPHELYEQLLARGVPRKRAVQLQNLLTHCGYHSWLIDDTEGRQADMLLLTPETAASALPRYAGQARDQKVTLVILAPYLNRERDRVCRAMAAAHTGTTVDNRGYLLFFNNGLPKQHFRL